MTNFLNILKLVVSLLPLLIDAVRAVEAAMPQAGQGQAKLSLIRSTLEAAFNVTNDVTVTFAQVWPALEKTVGAVVGAFNTTGVFKKD